MAIIDTTTNEVTYAGRVLSIRSRLVQIMSDVWDDCTFATVIEANGKTKEIMLYGECHNRTATIDATEEAKAEQAAYAAKDAALGDAHHKAQSRVQNLELAIAGKIRGTVARGEQVVVYKGRKVALGTTGKVFWTGECTFGIRAGVAQDDGSKFFIAIDNLCTVAQYAAFVTNQANKANLKKELVVARKEEADALAALQIHVHGRSLAQNA